MGTGNALRATETFTLIQLEEERQKLKKKELLKSMLTDSEFSIKGQCAINLMMTKLDIINTFGDSKAMTVSAKKCRKKDWT